MYQSVYTYTHDIHVHIYSGRFGIVHKCIHRQTGLQMVAKYVRLRSRKKAEIRREVEILRKISNSRSPYLMEFHNAYERGKNLIIVTEL